MSIVNRCRAPFLHSRCPTKQSRTCAPGRTSSFSAMHSGRHQTTWGLLANKQLSTRPGEQLPIHAPKRQNAGSFRRSTLGFGLREQLLVAIHSLAFIAARILHCLCRQSNMVGYLKFYTAISQMFATVWRISATVPARRRYR